MLQEIQEAYGYLPSAVLEWMSSRTGIPTSRMYGVANAAERILKIVDVVGMSHRLHDRIGTLSRGMQQRLSIARALLHEPELVLLDEPSSGVNPAMLDRLADRIIELNKEGLTFFIIGHNLSFIMKLSHYIHVLHYGKLITSGPPKTVAQDERVIEAYLGVHR
jgi:ABC-type branched-subunit amino acid transport system ATPase component